MGTRIGSPAGGGTSPAGDSCSICWGVGKPFGTGDTPEKLEISIQGVNKADDWIAALGEPVNGDFILTQVAAAACQWQYTGDGITIDYLYRPFDTQITVVNDKGFSTFLRQTVPPCVLLLTNGITSGFENGTALVTIPEVE